jgi:hypothetical protein
MVIGTGENTPNRGCRRRALIPYSLHVLQQHLLTAAVIELGGAAVGVAGDPLSGFQGAVIFQKVRDAGRPVRPKGRRESFPVFPIATGNQGDWGSFSKPVAFRYWSRSSSSLWCTGELLFPAPLLPERSKNPFPLG